MMSTMGKTIKCPICGQPYKFYMYSAADQSACPDCVAKASGYGKFKTTTSANS